jgi:hypothetical protein
MSPEALGTDEYLPEIRRLPAATPRVETGPVAFGEDWPGTFIRGDNAMNYALSLRAILDGQQPYEAFRDAFNRSNLRGLLRDLESSNLVTRP